MSRLYVRCNPVRDPEARREWASRHTRCAACWVPWNRCFPPIAVHHLIHGVGRSDEETCFLALCGRCHNTHHCGSRGPALTLAHCLWLKRESDPAEYDRKRLKELFGRTLPRAQRPPQWFFEQRSKWR